MEESKEGKSEKRGKGEKKNMKEQRKGYQVGKNAFPVIV